MAQIEFPPEGVTLGVWIGVFGKLLVKKGVLSANDLIAELTAVKQSQVALGTPIALGTAAEIDRMIATVKKW